VTTGGIDQPEPRSDLSDYVGHHVGPCLDLIACLGTDREPLCGAKEGATTVEMITAVFESHRRHGAAVTFPLQERENPLAKLS
jgi:hypothetical protein